MCRGRNKVFQITLLLFLLSQIGCALAPNIATLLIFRFVGGFFGSPTVTNSGGALTDLWEPSERSVPFALFSAASFLGPVIAPTIGDFLTTVSWRWNFWAVLIGTSFVYVMMVLFLPETYPPLLLRRKEYLAANQSKSHELRDALQNAQWRVSLTRPVVMLCTEPIVFSLSLYMAMIYGILYLDFTAYPIVFVETRDWPHKLSGLALLGIAIGMAIATIGSPLISHIHRRTVHRIGPVPEARLPHLIVLAWLAPIALFWFAWTADPPTPWIVPILSGILYGLSMVPLFLGITAYLTDCYGDYSASALAANAVLRSLFGAVFPLFATKMYSRLGTPWATSLLGFLATALAPLPLLFYVYGAKIRSVSRFHLQTMVDEHNSVRTTDREETAP